MNELSENNQSYGQREIRIWMDGAFDMMHYGHMNAFRQGKALGTYLIVGVNSSESITKCKGPPVMTDLERITAVEGCKFVDEVVADVPYIMDSDYVQYIMDEYKIDYIVHGDDPCIVDGKDVYEVAKSLGKYRTIPRTEGVSTTDIIGRLLMVGMRNSVDLPDDRPSQHNNNGRLVRSIMKNRTKCHFTLRRRLERSVSLDMSFDPTAASAAITATAHSPYKFEVNDESDDYDDDVAGSTIFEGYDSVWGSSPDFGSSVNGGRISNESKFLTTSKLLKLFSEDMRPTTYQLQQQSQHQQEPRRVVYVASSFDMFHAGDVAFLKQAKEKFGNYLVVGVHSDETVGRYSFKSMPVLSLQERVLSVLGCKYVDDVLIGAPYSITREMMASLDVHVVVHQTPPVLAPSRAKAATEATAPALSSKRMGIHHHRAGNGGGGNNNGGGGDLSSLPRRPSSDSSSSLASAASATASDLSSNDSNQDDEEAFACGNGGSGSSSGLGFGSSSGGGGGGNNPYAVPIAMGKFRTLPQDPLMEYASSPSSPSSPSSSSPTTVHISGSGGAVDTTANVALEGYSRSRSRSSSSSTSSYDGTEGLVEAPTKAAVATTTDETSTGTGPCEGAGSTTSTSTVSNSRSSSKSSSHSSRTRHSAISATKGASSYGFGLKMYHLSVLEIARRIHERQEIFQKKIAKKKLLEEEYYQNRYQDYGEENESASEIASHTHTHADNDGGGAGAGGGEAGAPLSPVPHAVAPMPAGEEV